MKTRILILLSFALLGLSGCYEDLGNYDYKDLNDIGLTISPENPDGEYIYGQPLRDTLKVTYSPVVSQSMYRNNENLKYKWEVSYKVKDVEDKDSLVTEQTEVPELTLKFPPNKETVYSVLFSLTDESNGTSYYRQLTMKTMLPFMNSWFVLHGNPGDRKLGVIERPNEETGRQISYDIYKTLFEERKFINAERLLYVGVNQADPWNLDKFQQLLIAERDSVYFAYAQKLSIERRYETMMPDPEGEHLAIIDGVTSQLTGHSLLIDERHRLYHSGGEGIYYSVKTPVNLVDYQVNRVFVSKDGFATVWDEVNRKLMYYNFRSNYYLVPRDEGGNRANLLPIDFPTTTTLPGNDTPINRDIIWLGKRVNASSSGMDGATVLVKDHASFTFYQINYAGSEAVEMNSVKIDKLDINDKSSIAVTSAFANQVFYSLENSVYCLNLLSKEVRMVYDAGGLITKLQFRIVDPIDRSLSEGEHRMLAVVVQKGNQGELHELFFNEAADISKVTVNTGFGPIQDIAFSIVTWNMFNKPTER